MGPLQGLSGVPEVHLTCFFVFGKKLALLGEVNSSWDRALRPEEDQWGPSRRWCFMENPREKMNSCSLPKLLTEAFSLFISAPSSSCIPSAHSSSGARDITFPSAPPASRAQEARGHFSTGLPSFPQAHEAGGRFCRVP